MAASPLRVQGRAAGCDVCAEPTKLSVGEVPLCWPCYLAGRQRACEVGSGRVAWVLPVAQIGAAA